MDKKKKIIISIAIKVVILAIVAIFVVLNYSSLELLFFKMMLAFFHFAGYPFIGGDIQLIINLSALSNISLLMLILLFIFILLVFDINSLFRAKYYSVKYRFKFIVMFYLFFII